MFNVWWAASPTQTRSGDSLKEEAQAGFYMRGISCLLNVYLFGSTVKMGGMRTESSLCLYKSFLDRFLARR